MKTKIVKRAEAEARQKAYNARLDERMRNQSTAEGRYQCLQEVSPSQKARLMTKFKLNADGTRVGEEPQEEKQSKRKKKS